MLRISNFGAHASVWECTIVVESLPKAQIQDCSYRGIRSGQSEPAIRDQIARRPNKVRLVLASHTRVQAELDETRMRLRCWAPKPRKQGKRRFPLLTGKEDTRMATPVLETRTVIGEPSRECSRYPPSLGYETEFVPNQTRLLLNFRSLFYQLSSK